MQRGHKMAEWQTVAGIAVTLTAILGLSGAWSFWLIRTFAQHLTERMDRNYRNLEERMDRNHRELLAYLQGHAHADSSPPVFHQLPDASAD